MKSFQPKTNVIMRIKINKILTHRFNMDLDFHFEPKYGFS